MQFDISKYKKWKRDNVTYRGIKNIGSSNKMYGSFGKGLYTVPLSNKSMAKQYGKVYFVVFAKPLKPKIVSTVNHAQILRQTLVSDFCNSHNTRYSLIYFQQHTSMNEQMIKLGFDGLIIQGRQLVNYKPGDNIQYFQTQEQLIKFYVKTIIL